MKLKSKKKWIIAILLIILIIISSIIITYKKIGFIYNSNITNLKNEQEQEPISINVEIKSVQDNINKCLITFTSNDEDRKIKSVEYPEENNVINVNNEEGKQKVAIDYDIENGKEDSTFKVKTTNGEIIEKRTGYTIHYDLNAEDASINNDTKIELKSKNATLDEIPIREGYIFRGWSKNVDSEIAEYKEEYVYQEGDEYITLYAVWVKDDVSLIEAIDKVSETSQITLNIKDESYDINVIVYDGNLVLDGNQTIEGSTLNDNVYEFGDKSKDVATANEYAKNMVVLKVKGDLTINDGVTLTACKSDNGYGGPKGLFVYCTGTLTNNGIISMTARGAYAQGQNVYLFKNIDKSYEYVPKVGGNGGNIVNERLRGNGSHINGNKGEDVGENSRKTGGGGSGKIYSTTTGSGRPISGEGGKGTSYSGGSGGGSAQLMMNGQRTAGSAGINGGRGGYSTTAAYESNNFYVYGGVGNPGGILYNNGREVQAKGENGTGGLLMIFANSISNKGKIESNGIGNGRHNAGGSSGGGSINIFYKEVFENENSNNITATGGISTNDATYGKAGNGGNGSVTIGSIATETFEALESE